MITPIDIQNKDFAKKLKGYDCDEVDDFLDEIIKDYGALLKENQALKGRVAMLTRTIDNYKSIEESMTKSVEMAKQTAHDIKENAKAEAQMLLNNAKLDATRLAKQIDDEHIKRHQEILRVKSQTDMFKERVKSLCDSMTKMLDDIE